MNPNQGVLVMHICIDLLFNYLKDSLIKQYYVHPVGRYTVLLLQTPSGGYDNNMQWASQQRVLETEFPAPVLRVDIISYICIGSTCCLFNGKQIARSGVSIHVSSCTSSKKSIAPSVWPKKKTGSCYYHGLHVLPFSFRKKTSWVTG
jgi:hypothetical protein